MRYGRAIALAGLVAGLVGLAPIAVLPGVTQTITQTADQRKAESDQFLKPCRDHLQQQQYEAAIQSCQQAADSLRQRGNRYGEARAITNGSVLDLWTPLNQHAKFIAIDEQSNDDIV